MTATDTESDAITFGISGGTTGGSYLSGGVTYDVSKAGTYGTLYVVSTGTDTGKYLFVPNNTAINARATNNSENYTVTATDASHTGSPTTATLAVSVTAANDTPALTAPTAIALTDTAADTFTNQTGTLAGSDRDTGATLTYGITGGTTGGSDTISAVTYDVSKIGTYGTLYVASTGADKGKYVYVPSNSAINALATGASPAESFTVTVSDGGLSATQSLDINLTATNDNPVNTVAPAVTGTHSVGQTLTGGTGTFTDAESNTLTYSYQWYTATDNAGTGAAAITGATNST